MATVTAGYNWTSGEIVTPAKLNSAAAPTVAVADGEITANKISDSSVTTAKLAASLDLSNKTLTLPDNSVSSAKIADGAVTQAKLNAGVTLVPTGAVMPFAMNSAPTGWLICNGDVIPNTTGTVQGKTANFSALFALLGTTYGASGKLPDLRGYFVRGAGTNSDETASGTFGQRQADAFQSHGHSYKLDHGIASGDIAAFAQSTVNRRGTGAPPDQTIINTTGGNFRTANETRPANIALLYCIKY